MTHSPVTDVTILVGNGLSIAFNEELGLKQITRAVHERIRASSEGGTDVVEAMKQIADRALPEGVSSDDDFEVLVDAFGAESTTLGHLDTLAALTDPSDEDLREAIRRVILFANDIRDMGISHVLEIIEERTVANALDAANLVKFVEAICSTFDGRITWANLNYDTLLLYGLMQTCQDELADLGHGFKKVTFSTSTRTFRVPALRTESDFPNGRRVRLLHLHGSITYWGNRDTGVAGKLPRELLVAGGLWRSVRSRHTAIRPLVVLANRRDKSAHIQRMPFRLAYEGFTASLNSSMRWLIVGYSFRDEPVNRQLQLAFAEKAHPPRVLVVTFGDDLSRRDVELALGWGRSEGESSWLRIYRGGALGAQDTDDFAWLAARDA